MVQARWSPRADWDVELIGRHVGERQTSAAVVLPAYQHFDARIGWRSSPDWQWSFQASNLFDKRTAEYWESLKVNTAQGRAWVLGLQVRL
jgi:outer membrane receptor protein involved in Fe transport